MIFAAASFTQSSYTAAQADDPVAIVNKNLVSVDLNELKRVFTGKVSKWRAGGDTQVIFNSDTKLADDFAKKYFGMSFKELNDIWVTKCIRDGVVAPKNLSSGIILSAVGNSEKFIGFVKRSEVNENVRIIE